MSTSLYEHVYIYISKSGCFWAMSSMMSFSFVVGRERTNCEKIGCLRCPIKEWDNNTPGDFELFADVQTKTSWGSFGQVVFNRISQNLIPENFKIITPRSPKRSFRMWMPWSIWCWRVNWWRACVRMRWWLPKMFLACQGFAYPWRKVALRGAG